MVLLIGAEEPQSISIARVKPEEFNTMALLLRLSVVESDTVGKTAVFMIGQITIKLYKEMKK